MIIITRNVRMVAHSISDSTLISPANEEKTSLHVLNYGGDVLASVDTYPEAMMFLRILEMVQKGMTAQHLDAYLYNHVEFAGDYFGESTRHSQTRRHEQTKESLQFLALYMQLNSVMVGGIVHMQDADRMARKRLPLRPVGELFDFEVYRKTLDHYFYLLTWDISTCSVGMSTADKERLVEIEKEMHHIQEELETLYAEIDSDDDLCTTFAKCRGTQQVISRQEPRQAMAYTHGQIVPLEAELAQLRREYEELRWVEIAGDPEDSDSSATDDVAAEISRCA